MNKFKVGDKVRCIKNGKAWVQLDPEKIYTVTNITKNKHLKLDINVEYIKTWSPERFKLVEEEKPKTFFEVGKEYQLGTIIGTCVFVGTSRAVIRMDNGEEYTPDADMSMTLWEPAPPSPAKDTVWVNVYKNKDSSRNRHHISSLHASRQAADNVAKYVDPKKGERIACVEVLWEEGQGLEDSDEI